MASAMAGLSTPRVVSSPASSAAPMATPLPLLGTALVETASTVSTRKPTPTTSPPAPAAA